MQKLYDEANATQGFKYHGGRPTHVFVYLYTSPEHFKAGMGQWIAMLSKISEGAQPEAQVKTELVAQLGIPPEIKHDLSEATRIEIFGTIVRAEDRARQEAEKIFPIDSTSSLAVGQKFTLSKQTPMMPELEPVDPTEALQRIRQLAPGTQITVLRVEQKNSSPWYEIRALSSARGALGSGWINSIALMGQSTIDPKIQLGRQFKKESELTEKYKVEIREAIRHFRSCSKKFRLRASRRTGQCLREGTRRCFSEGESSAASIQTRRSSAISARGSASA